MNFFMKNKKNFIIVGVLLLFVFTLTLGIHFFKEVEEIPNIPKNPVELPEEDDLEFTNDSSYSVDEIWNIVETKKNALRSLFYDSKVYEPHEVDSSKYTVSDNEHYTVFNQSFLEELNRLVVDDIYFSYLNQMTLLKDHYYVAKQDIFDDIYLNSAIAEIDVLSSEVRLITATDNLINASVFIQVCEDDDTNCEGDFIIPLELVKVGNDWKVSRFY